MAHSSTTDHVAPSTPSNGDFMHQDEKMEGKNKKQKKKVKKTEREKKRKGKESRKVLVELLLYVPAINGPGRLFFFGCSFDPPIARFLAPAPPVHSFDDVSPPPFIFEMCAGFRRQGAKKGYPTIIDHHGLQVQYYIFISFIQ